MGSLSEKFVEALLLAGRAGPRLLNESSVPFSVWKAFADGSDEPVQLLLTPMETTPAAQLARHLHERLPAKTRLKPPRIMPVEGAVAVTLDWDDFLAAVIPAMGLDVAGAWEELRFLIACNENPDAAQPRPLSLGDLLHFAFRLPGLRDRRPVEPFEMRTAPDNSGVPELRPDLRTALLVVLIDAVRRLPRTPEGLAGDADLAWREERLEPSGQRKLLRAQRIAFEAPPSSTERLIWRAAINRPVQPLGVSVETIKADAAMRVFDIDCRSITWAVLDSGIDGSHPAFLDHAAGDGAIRIEKAYDFSSLRDLASYDTLLDPQSMRAAVRTVAAKLMVRPLEARRIVERLRDDAAEGRPYDWDALSRLLEVAPDVLPSRDGERPEGHGTHVAGVLAGDWRENGRTVFRGVCPTLRLYDLRILGRGAEETEFAVIAALAFIRWLNGRNRYMTIHGANLSIGLVHDKHGHACGRTPVCLACDATVASGVSIVAAAGNWGSQTYLTVGDEYEGYAPMSIADPGNAASVITVGSTHRDRPHEYGVSFFSSRGPTGDGRPKPDLVAPGEKIEGPLPDLGFGTLDGTSMAAPHVSGVAALLMARNVEMIGAPDRVKATIVASATDLGRERYFQGAGLLDALRALQSV
jgi:hypothetical protein